MIVTGVTQTQEIPHEEGASITFRKLSWREWQHAAEVKRTEAFEMFKGMPAELLEAMRQKESPALVAESDQYDTYSLLRAGIIAWSYPEPLTAENIKLLDSQTAEWAIEQILASRKSDTKNSSAVSSGQSEETENSQQNG